MMQCHSQNHIAYASLRQSTAGSKYRPVDRIGKMLVYGEELAEFADRTDQQIELSMFDSLTSPDWRPAKLTIEEFALRLGARSCPTPSDSRFYLTGQL